MIASVNRCLTISKWERHLEILEENMEWLIIECFSIHWNCIMKFKMRYKKKKFNGSNKISLGNMHKKLNCRKSCAHTPNTLSQLPAQITHYVRILAEIHNRTWVLVDPFKKYICYFKVSKNSNNFFHVHIILILTCANF
jgi:hypothetical protein